VLALVDERYQCTGCGDCCRGWSVPLLPGEGDRFRTLAAALIPVERLKGAIHGARAGGVAVEALGGAGGRCAALADDDRCVVHAEHGGDAKPLACRLFPFTFVATPSEVRVSLSFACPAVIDGEGPLLAEQRADVEALYKAIEGSPYRMSVDGEVALTETRALPWADAARLLGEVLHQRPVELTPDGHAGVQVQQRRERRLGDGPVLRPVAKHRSPPPPGEQAGALQLLHPQRAAEHQLPQRQLEGLDRGERAGALEDVRLRRRQAPA